MSPWVFGDKQDKVSPSKTFEIQRRRQTGTQKTVTQLLAWGKGVEWSSRSQQKFCTVQGRASRSFWDQEYPPQTTSEIKSLVFLCPERSGHLEQNHPTNPALFPCGELRAKEGNRNGIASLNDNTEVWSAQVRILGSTASLENRSVLTSSCPALSLPSLNQGGQPGENRHTGDPLLVTLWIQNLLIT